MFAFWNRDARSVPSVGAIAIPTVAEILTCCSLDHEGRAKVLPEPLRDLPRVLSVAESGEHDGELVTSESRDRGLRHAAPGAAFPASRRSARDESRRSATCFRS